MMANTIHCTSLENVPDLIDRHMQIRSMSTGFVHACLALSNSEEMVSTAMVAVGVGGGVSEQGAHVYVFVDQ